MVENVFYDPLRLDGEKPLCDESGGISPQDSNSKQQCASSNYLLKMRSIFTGCKYMKKLPNKGVEILNCKKRNSQLGEKPFEIRTVESGCTDPKLVVIRGKLSRSFPSLPELIATNYREEEKDRGEGGGKVVIVHFFQTYPFKMQLHIFLVRKFAH